MEFEESDVHYENKLKAKNALYRVIDPELFVNIIDLGLVYDINFEDDKIIVTMTLTTPGCPMGDAISNGVENALEADFPEKTPVVNLVFSPPWSVEKLTPEGRDQLGM